MFKKARFKTMLSAAQTRHESDLAVFKPGPESVRTFQKKLEQFREKTRQRTEPVTDATKCFGMEYTYDKSICMTLLVYMFKYVHKYY